MPISFTLKVDDVNYALVQQAFGADTENDIAQKVVDFLLQKILVTQKTIAHSTATIDYDEIEIDED